LVDNRPHHRIGLAQVDNRFLHRETMDGGDTSPLFYGI
jgi:hypothetical protein